MWQANGKIIFIFSYLTKNEKRKRGQILKEEAGDSIQCCFIPKRLEGLKSKEIKSVFSLGTPIACCGIGIGAKLLQIPN